MTRKTLITSSRTLAGAAAMALAVLLAPQSATAAIGDRDRTARAQVFNPHVNAPKPYDRRAISVAGYGGDLASGGCHWTRDQTYVGGKLVWRPLLQCYYGW